jgi:outer membrane murein-binding lipoprotein Lpp
MQPCSLLSVGKKASSMLMAFLLGSGMASPQQPPQALNAPQANQTADALRDLEAQIRELSSSLHEMHAEVERSSAEAAQLRQELQETREQVSALRNEMSASHINPPAVDSAVKAEEEGQCTGGQLDQRVAKVEEDQQLLGAKIEDQYQTKVESGSKYRVKLSGMVLLNLFTNRGGANNLDLPTEARPPMDTNAVFGATIRQSLLGLELFGPDVAGAKSKADIEADFFGGLPNTPNGVTMGLFRLRTGGFRLDWERTSVVAGQYTPFFSPLSPTSLATVAYPPFADSGNLWTWTPQVEIEHRFSLSEASRLTLQGGILDPLTGEPPYDSYYRSASAGEKTGQPAYAARIAWTHGGSNRPLTVGLGGYYERQNWGFGRIVDGWAGTADWSLPLAPWLLLTGEFYRGRAIGGLGAASGVSVVFNGNPISPQTEVQGLNTTGGWAQLKFTPFERLEFNGAFGEDFPSPSDLREYPFALNYFNAGIGRNESAFVNGIYHVRSNFLLSLEYRRLWTAATQHPVSTTNHVNLGAAFLF